MFPLSAEIEYARLTVIVVSVVFLLIYLLVYFIKNKRHSYSGSGRTKQDPDVYVIQEPEGGKPKTDTWDGEFPKSILFLTVLPVLTLGVLIPGIVAIASITQRPLLSVLCLCLIGLVIFTSFKICRMEKVGFLCLSAICALLLIGSIIFDCTARTNDLPVTLWVFLFVVVVMIFPIIHYRHFS